MDISWVKICNMSLSLLGKDLIMDIQDVSEASKYCDIFLEQCRDAVLRSHAWSCAKHRARLALSADYYPPSDYVHAYALPNNPYCLRVLHMGNEIDDYDYTVEGRYLLTNEPEAIITYIKRITDPGELDALCVDAIAARLAADLAMPLTGSRTIMENMWTIYERKLDLAKGISRTEGPSQTIDPYPSWIDVR